MFIFRDCRQRSFKFPKNKGMGVTRPFRHSVAEKGRQWAVVFGVRPLQHPELTLMRGKILDQLHCTALIIFHSSFSQSIADSFSLLDSLRNEPIEIY